MLVLVLLSALALVALFTVRRAAARLGVPLSALTPRARALARLVDRARIVATILTRGLRERALRVATRTLGRARAVDLLSRWMDVRVDHRELELVDTTRGAAALTDLVEDIEALGVRVAFFVTPEGKARVCICSSVAIASVPSRRVDAGELLGGLLWARARALERRGRGWDLGEPRHDPGRRWRPRARAHLAQPEVA